MNFSRPLSNDRLGIPEALALDHEELRADLIKARNQPGRIGAAAARAARFYCAHFAKEEEVIFRVFGLLHDVASDRLQPHAAAIGETIRAFDIHCRNLHDADQTIHSILDELLHEAVQYRCSDIVELVCRLRNHEAIEDKEMYPAAAQVARSVREGSRIL
jgi:hypothetical protein